MKPWAVEALAELRAQREAIDAAIAAIERLGGVAPAPARGAAAPRPTGALSDRSTKVLAALQAGDTTAGAIAAATKLSKSSAQYELKKLVKAGHAPVEPEQRILDSWW